MEAQDIPNSDRVWKGDSAEPLSSIKIRVIDRKGWLIEELHAVVERTNEVVDVFARLIWRRSAGTDIFPEHTYSLNCGHL